MADITKDEHADAIRWHDEKPRKAAALLRKALGLIDEVITDWEDGAGGFATLFGMDPAGIVQDGSPADGRTPIRCGETTAFHKLCRTLRDMADDDRDPTTGAHTGMTSRMLIHKFARGIDGPGA